jgi:rubrerythrin
MKIEDKFGKWQIEGFNDLEAYRIAFRLEQEGTVFYKLLIERFGDEKDRNIITILLNQNKSHLEYFWKGYVQREKKEKLYEKIDLLSYGIFLPYHDNLQTLKATLLNRAKSVHVAIDIENIVLKYYEAWHAKLPLGSEKNELTNIIKDENKHKVLLQDLLV